MCSRGIFWWQRKPSGGCWAGGAGQCPDPHPADTSRLNGAFVRVLYGIFLTPFPFNMPSFQPQTTVLVVVVVEVVVSTSPPAPPFLAAATSMCNNLASLSLI